MKRIYLICVLLLIAGYSIAQEGTHFENLTFKDALAKAAKTGKPLFIDCYTKTCGPCKYMVKYIFPLEKCGEYFNSHYISIMKDMEEGDGLEIAQKYNIRTYPTYLILHGDGTEYCRVVGGVQSPEEDFVQKIKDAILLAELNKKYKAGDQSKEFIENYTNFLIEHDKAQLQEVIGKLWPALGVKELSKPQYWEIIQDLLKSTDHPLFQYILKNRKAFSKILSPDTVESKLLNTYAEEFRIYKLMGLDYASRIAALKSLEKDGCQAVCPLYYSMLARDIIDHGKKDQIKDIITLIDKKLPELSDSSEQMQVIRELGDLQDIATPEQIVQICSSLANLGKTMDAGNATYIKHLISRLSGNNADH